MAPIVVGGHSLVVTLDNLQAAVGSTLVIVMRQNFPSCPD